MRIIRRDPRASARFGINFQHKKVLGDGVRTGERRRVPHRADRNSNAVPLTVQGCTRPVSNRVHRERNKVGKMGRETGRPIKISEERGKTRERGRSAARGVGYRRSNENRTRAGDGEETGETVARQRETTAKKRRPTMGRLSKVVIPRRSRLSTDAAPGPSIKPSDLASPSAGLGRARQGGGARISKIKGSTMAGNQWLVFGQCRNAGFQSLADNNALGLVYKSAHCCQLKSSRATATEVEAENLTENRLRTRG